MTIETSYDYIDDLNPAYPEAATEVGDGDDHIRGIKNALTQSFPNISGACTATHVQLNNVAFATSVDMVFYEASEPSGWTESTVQQFSALRVNTVASTAGGSSGGTDNFTTIDLDHTHTDNIAVNSHSLTAANIPKHYHYVGLQGGGGSNTTPTSSNYLSNSGNNNGDEHYNLKASGTEPNSLRTGDEINGGGSATEVVTHTVTGGVITTSGLDFQFKYMDVIVCHPTAT